MYWNVWDSHASEGALNCTYTMTMCFQELEWPILILLRQ